MSTEEGCRGFSRAVARGEIATCRMERAVNGRGLGSHLLRGTVADTLQDARAGDNAAAPQGITTTPAAAVGVARSRVDAKHAVICVEDKLLQYCLAAAWCLGGPQHRILVRRWWRGPVGSLHAMETGGGGNVGAAHSPPRCFRMTCRLDSLHKKGSRVRREGDG